jgi:peptidoglycan/LPS O-acetylase OafA/YrhL
MGMTSNTQATEAVAGDGLAKPKVDGRRFVGLDGLRGYLALCVILVHTLGLFAPIVLHRTHADLLGQAIVVFFALSGFLIYLPFMYRILDARPLPSIRDYARGRIFRVYPAYIVIFLIANFALSGLFLSNAMETMVPGSDAGTGMIVDPLRLLLHLTLLQNYFPGELQTGINSSWTLTIEITFYALLPLLSLAALRIARSWTGGRRYLAAALPGLALIVLGAVSRVIAWALFESSGISLLDAEWGANPLGVFSRSFAIWADNFGWGMLAIVAFAAIQRGDLVRVGRLRARMAALVLLAVALVAAAISVLTETRPLPFIVAVGAAAFFLVLVLPNRRGATSLFSRAVDWVPVRYVGLVSLSTYLWHYPVLLVVLRLDLAFPDTIPGAAANVAMIALISIALASVSYWLVERPAQAFAARRAASRRT